MKTILAAPNLLKIEKIALYPGEVRLVAKARPLKSACPSCGRQSGKVHSRYRRHLADLPWEGIEHYFAWTNDLCLSDSAIEINVNYLLYEQTDKKGEVTRWTWITSLPLEARTVEKVMRTHAEPLEDRKRNLQHAQESGLPFRA